MSSSKPTELDRKEKKSIAKESGPNLGSNKITHKRKGIAAMGHVATLNFQSETEKKERNQKETYHPTEPKATWNQLRPERKGGNPIRPVQNPRTFTTSISPTKRDPYLHI